VINFNKSLNLFIKTDVAKYVEAFDSGEIFDRAVLAGAINHGLLDAIFTSKGFANDGLFALAKILEDVSGVCGNSRNFFLVSCGMFGKALERFNKNNFFVEDVYEKIRNGVAIGAVAHTEKSGGSDHRIFKTRLTRSNTGDFVLNGHKTWITFAGIADYFLVSCFLGEDLVFVLVPKSSLGIEIKLIESLSGNRGSGIADINFDGVVIQKNQIMPSMCDESKWPIFEWIFSVGRVLAASSAIGLIKASIKMSFLRLKSRESFGKKLIESQVWQQELAEMSSQLRAIECLRDISLNYLDEFKYDFLNSDCSMVKNIASNLAIQAAQMNVRVHGAYGYLESEPPNRLLREAVSFEFIEGTNYVLNRKIFAQISGQMIVQSGKNK